MARILVIDDEALMRTMCEVICQRHDHELLQASTIQDGLTLGQQGCDVVLLDVLLPDGNGLDFQRAFAQLPGAPDVVIVTGHGDGASAEAALQSGAWDFLYKPVVMRDIELCLRSVLAARRNRMAGNVPLQVDSGHLLGSGAAMVKALKMLSQAARSDVNVLLLGETGVGKELFARALFRNSTRAAHPFVVVDCASLPETLVESQLFGHTRGAFTGADRARDGLLLSAHRGTLFLDEVGDLPLAMQGSFLRVLETHTFRPVGGEREVESDFRLVAATNRNVDDMVRQGSFRGDLLYRLQGMTITIPPLRQRRDEIPALANHTIAAFCRSGAQHKKTLSEQALDILLEYNWPGNVRELVHSVQRACVAAGQEEVLLPQHLPTQLRVAVTNARAGVQATGRAHTASAPNDADDAFADGIPLLKEYKNRAEEIYIRRLMALCGGDARAAAKSAGVSRGHWYELLKKYNL